MSLVRVQLWEPKRADDKSHLLFCCFGDIYSLAVNQDGVGERSESGVKAGKRKLYSVQFSRRGRLRRAWLWEPERADDKSHLLFCCFGDVYSLAVNQDGVGERSENYSISQSATLTALFTKESLAIRSV